MANFRVHVEVIRIKGHCLFYQVGDKFTVTKQALELETPRHCYHAVAGLYGLVMLARGGVFEENFYQCLDPGPDYGLGDGTVYFKVTKGEEIP